MRAGTFAGDQFTLTIQISIIVAWWLFAAVFLLGRSPAGTAKAGKAKRRDPMALFGVLLQGIGYAFVWTCTRPGSSPLLPFGPSFGTPLLLSAPVIALSSVWLSMWAIRTLGRQWALNARLVEGHALITSGPFAFIRHPIYTGMLGMLLATGIAFSEAWALGVAVAFFAAGLAVRVRAEERLLAGEFGAAFEEYRRTVPAVLPFSGPSR
jgi:protein-S-isoprenylcysteine O-methyltransferase Ste14